MAVSLIGANGDTHESGGDQGRKRDLLWVVYSALAGTVPVEASKLSGGDQRAERRETETSGH